MATGLNPMCHFSKILEMGLELKKLNLVCLIRMCKKLKNREKARRFVLKKRRVQSYLILLRKLTLLLVQAMDALYDCPTEGEEGVEVGKEVVGSM